jgi:hypothetical protein
LKIVCMALMLINWRKQPKYKREIKFEVIKF